MVWCVINNQGIAIDVSKTQHGAKCYATRNGYDKIGMRSGYSITNELYKMGNRWVYQQ